MVELTKGLSKTATSSIVLLWKHPTLEGKEKKKRFLQSSKEFRNCKGHGVDGGGEAGGGLPWVTSMYSTLSLSVAQFSRGGREHI